VLVLTPFFLFFFWPLCGVVSILVFKVFNRTRSMNHPILVNLITAAGLGFLLALDLVATVSDLFGSGIIELDDNGFVDFLCTLVLLGLWSLLAFALNAGLRLRREPSASWSSVLLAGTQLAVIIVMMFGLFAFQATCVAEDNGSDAICGVPTRPGVIVPTPLPDGTRALNS